ncbi:amino acid ABC transporter permease [Paraburkholderia sediminicola]|uniref:Amino acid ABC transporter permease n=1 Tax=Paraburkholderia metrosideri TaxID=580937 RepID=A0ABW9DVA4_9BURK
MKFHIDYLWSVLPALASAALTNLRLAAIAILMALVLGTALTILRAAKIGWINSVIAVVISFVRGTPLLIQIFIFFYVLPAAGLNLSAPTAGVAALAFNSMVFVSEILRAGLGTLDPGQVEAATALGLRPASIWRYIVLPQVLRRALPVLVNEASIVVKGTALLSVITVVDVLRTAQQIAAESFRPFETLLGAALMFVLINLMLNAGAHIIEHKVALRS